MMLTFILILSNTIIDGGSRCSRRSTTAEEAETIEESVCGTLDKTFATLLLGLLVLAKRIGETTIGLVAARGEVGAMDLAPLGDSDGSLGNTRPRAVPRGFLELAVSTSHVREGQGGNQDVDRRAHVGK